MDITVNIFAVFLFLIVILLTTIQILSRYVFQFPIAFSDEVSRFLFIWISFLGAAMVMKDNSHIRLDIISEKLSPLGVLILNIFIQSLIFVFSITVTGQGLKLLGIAAKQVAPVSRISMGVVYSVIPFAFFLMAVYSLFHIVFTVHDYLKGETQS